MKLNRTIIEEQLRRLQADYPELAEDEILRADMIEAETELHDFMRQIENSRRENVMLSAALGAYIDELHSRKARLAMRDLASRKIMFRLMEMVNLKKIELPEATISIRAGTPKVIITDENALPDSLCRIKREPDKTKIKEALEFGEVTGATLSNAEPTLSIRTK